MSPTSSSSPLAGRNARSATLRTKSLPCPAADDGQAPSPRRRATGAKVMRRALSASNGNRSRSLAQTSQHHDVHAAAALEVAGAHDALLGEPQTARERAGGLVARRGGDLQAGEAERVEGPLGQQGHGGRGDPAAAGGGDEPGAGPAAPGVPKAHWVSGARGAGATRRRRGGGTSQ